MTFERQLSTLAPLLAARSGYVGGWNWFWILLVLLSVILIIAFVGPWGRRPR
jgi:hypothetical protein